MAFRRSVPFFRHTVAAVGVASVAVLGLSAPAGAATDTESKTKIDTYSTWDDGTYLQPFGNPQTSNYGQVITIPEGEKKLKKFTYYMAALTGTGTLTFRAEVYGWDGTKATRQIFESDRMTVDIEEGNPDIQRVKVKTTGTKVKAGKQYVLFLTLDKDYEENPANLLAQWPTHYEDVLPGGYVVYLNSNGDEEQWTTAPWSIIDTFDFAMKATLK